MSYKDTSVVIRKDKVYSSYYAKACKIIPDFRLVAISIGIPDNFNGEILRELNPSKELLYRYKNKLCDEEEYIKTYTDETLNKVNSSKIYEKLKGKVILCYCKDTFCHRHIVIDWLKREIGQSIIGGEIWAV